MEKPYVSIESCMDLARLYLKKSGAPVTDEDVQSLADAIAGQISRLVRRYETTPAYRPECPSVIA